MTSAFSITDDRGKNITLTKPASRVISLAPNITETIYAIGAGHTLVGVIQGSDYPEAARKLPQVGSYLGLDLEKILSLRPDLIITWGKVFSRQLSVLEKAGIPVYQSDPHRLEDMPVLIKQLGILLGVPTKANQTADQFSQHLKTLKERYHTNQPVTVFYQMGNDALMTINQDSWINEMIELCGGKNLFANLHGATPEISWEAAVTAKPQVILNDSSTDTWKARWAKWSSVPAVRQHRLYTIKPDLIERLGPRTLEGVESLCQALK